MMILTGKTIVSALRPPYPYGGEFVGHVIDALFHCHLGFEQNFFGSHNSREKKAA